MPQRKTRALSRCAAKSRDRAVRRTALAGRCGGDAARDSLDAYQIKLLVAVVDDGGNL